MWVDAVIFVFSLEDEISFQTVYHYYSRMANYRNTSEIPMVLVGTQGKCSLDLRLCFCDCIDCSKLAKPCPVLSPLLHQHCHVYDDESLWINWQLNSRVVVCCLGFLGWLATGPRDIARTGLRWEINVLAALLGERV